MTERELQDDPDADIAIDEELILIVVLTVLAVSVFCSCLAVFCCYSRRQYRRRRRKESIRLLTEMQLENRNRMQTIRSAPSSFVINVHVDPPKPPPEIPNIDLDPAKHIPPRGRGRSSLHRIYGYFIPDKSRRNRRNVSPKRKPSLVSSAESRKASGFKPKINPERNPSPIRSSPRPIDIPYHNNGHRNISGDPFAERDDDDNVAPSPLLKGLSERVEKYDHMKLPAASANNNTFNELLDKSDKVNKIPKTTPNNVPGQGSVPSTEFDPPPPPPESEAAGGTPYLQQTLGQPLGPAPTSTVKKKNKNKKNLRRRLYDSFFRGLLSDSDDDDVEVDSHQVEVFDTGEDPLPTGAARSKVSNKPSSSDTMRRRLEGIFHGQNRKRKKAKRRRNYSNPSAFD